jgi:hypothetical protein
MFVKLISFLRKLVSFQKCTQQTGPPDENTICFTKKLHVLPKNFKVLPKHFMVCQKMLFFAKTKSVFTIRLSIVITLYDTGMQITRDNLCTTSVPASAAVGATVTAGMVHANVGQKRLKRNILRRFFLRSIVDFLK